MIKLNNITKTYPFGDLFVAALSDVTLYIRPQEYVSIVGPSGSGKSTLMNIIGCLDTPTSGSYQLDGLDVSGLGANELANIRSNKIGFVFQGFHLLPRLTALENVALPLLLQGVPPKMREERAEEALRQVGLSQRMGHKPSQLSGGQQQRVAIARALIHNPRVLLADEPTGSLDEQSTREVLALLDGLHQKGHTIVLITHDASVAERADRRVSVSAGQVH
jgi:putative ABC transport system ATP-binding protein